MSEDTPTEGDWPEPAPEPPADEQTHEPDHVEPPPDDESEE